VQVSVGTFNLNNLFSPYNFQGEIQAIAAGDNTVEAQYEFTDPTSYRLRTFMGRLVKGKDPQDTVRIATRIASIDLDVLRFKRSRTSARGRSSWTANSACGAINRLFGMAPLGFIPPQVKSHVPTASTTPNQRMGIRAEGVKSHGLSQER